MLTLMAYLKIFGKIIPSKLLTQNTPKLILLFINQTFLFPLSKLIIQINMIENFLKCLIIIKEKFLVTCLH